MDGVDWEIMFSYRTAFAYLYKRDRGTLRGPHLNRILHRVLCLCLSCGQFLYGAIEPSAILGVSGTVGDLNDTEQEIVKDFGINKYAFLPSVYGANNFSFDKAGCGIKLALAKAHVSEAE
eukprot:9502125-Ditylum_brightwellii.AAC.1